MRIIFLDIDGVLNSREYMIRRSSGGLFGASDGDAIDTAAVKLLNHVLDKTDARIVISSSWRVMYRGVFPDLVAVLEQRGVIAGRIIDRTMLRHPTDQAARDERHMAGRIASQRGDQIKQWLAHHAAQLPEPDLSWAWPCDACDEAGFYAPEKPCLDCAGEGWLKRMRNWAPVTSYVVVDDDNDMDALPPKRFVQTGWEHGLQPEHVERMIAILETPLPPDRTT